MSVAQTTLLLETRNSPRAAAGRERRYQSAALLASVLTSLSACGTQVTFTDETVGGTTGTGGTTHSGGASSGGASSGGGPPAAGGRAAGGTGSGDGESSGGSSGPVAGGNDSSGGSANCDPQAGACEGEICADGRLQANEECDDMGAADGCSATCAWELSFVAAGGHHNCAIRAKDGQVKCWGRNSAGQLGLGDKENRGDTPDEMGSNLSAVDLGTGRSATALSLGLNHSCALLDDSSVKCWGDNTYGQLGVGDQVVRGDNPGEMGDRLPAVLLGTGRTARAISSGEYSVCAQLDDSSVKCWGLGNSGQLGQGSTNNLGDTLSELGNGLPAVSLGPGRTATTLSASSTHVCVVLDDSSVKCWGDNRFGQLGTGDIERRGDMSGELGELLPAIPLGTNRKARTVTAGDLHTCVLLDDKAVKCWGNNSAGQLGQGDTVIRGSGANQLGDSLLPIALGTNHFAEQLSAGYSHTCALLDDKSLKCWGFNASGQLGLGDTLYRGDGAGEMGDALPTVPLGSDLRVVDMSLGHDHTCALLDNLTIKCWGKNADGQLGYGDTGDRGDRPGEMGDGLLSVRPWGPETP
jgi:cysteine-rich repeat protein